MGAGGDGGGNGATVTVGAGGVVGLEQATSAKPIIAKLPDLFDKATLSCAVTFRKSAYAPE